MSVCRFVLPVFYVTKKKNHFNPEKSQIYSNKIGFFLTQNYTVVTTCRTPYPKNVTTFKSPQHTTAQVRTHLAIKTAFRASPEIIPLKKVLSIQGNIFAFLKAHLKDNENLTISAIKQVMH